MQRSPQVEAALDGIRASTDVQQMRELIQHASQEALSFEPAPGEWSIIEILRHLGDTEEMRQVRFDRMLAEENQVLDRVSPEPGDRDRDEAEVLVARYERVRTRALERLSSMTEARWRRVGTQLPDRQVQRTVPSPTSILRESQKINLHSGRHLKQLRDNLASFQRSAAARK